MKVIPQGNRIIVEPIKDTGNGIIIPEVAEMEYIRSRVVAVGPGKLLEDGTYQTIPLKEGDEVVFDSRAVKVLTPPSFYGDQNLAVVDYLGVLCKVEREPGEVVSYSKREPEPQPLAVPSPEITQAIKRQRRN